MEQSLVWSKTLLSALKVIKGVYSHYDRIIESRTIRVPGCNECQSDFDSTFNQVDKILSYIEAKKRIVLVAEICEKVLGKLFTSYKKALIIKYKYNKTNGEIESILSCTIRTFFRHINEGIKQFKEIKDKLGYTDDFLEKTFSGDVWIMSLKLKIEENNVSKLKRSTNRAYPKKDFKNFKVA